MSQNRAGLTFEALIHENKKRPNNRLQKLLEQKLFILKSMKDESDRMYRKERRDLITRQKIYDRILGSLTHTYTSAESRKETRMSEVLNNDWDPLNVQGILRDQGLYGLPPSDELIEPEEIPNPKLDRKRLSTSGAFGVKKRNTKSHTEKADEGEGEEEEEKEKEEVVVPVKKRTWKDALREIKEQQRQVQIDTCPSEMPLCVEKTFVSEVIDESEVDLELPPIADAKLTIKDDSTSMTKLPHIENGPMSMSKVMSNA